MNSIFYTKEHINFTLRYGIPGIQISTNATILQLKLSHVMDETEQQQQHQHNQHPWSVLTSIQKVLTSSRRHVIIIIYVLRHVLLLPNRLF